MRAIRYAVMGLMLVGCSGENYGDVTEWEFEPPQAEPDTLALSEWDYEPGAAAPDTEDPEKSRFDASYGISVGPNNRQFRCVPGQVGDCLIPLKKVVQVDLQVDGIPLDADRTAFSAAINEGISRSNLPDSRFDYHRANGTGCAPDEVCLTIRPQGGVVGAPPGLATDDVRKYVSYSYGTVNDMGTHATFKTILARGDWVAIKAYRGDTVCTNVSGDVCFNGMMHMVLNAMAAASGTGISTNVSVTGKGNDRDVDGNTGQQCAVGDICRQRDYDPANPTDFAVDPDACSQ